MKEYMERITSSMDEFRLELRNNTVAVRANTLKLDDLITWRPDQERHVADLGLAVANLQSGRVPAAAAPGAAAAGLPSNEPTLPAAGDPSDADAHAGELPHGTHDHGDAFLHRGKSSVATPTPLPGTGQFSLQSPVSATVPSPFAHASQLLAGLGQAHPSICFPQFSSENPKLWKTLCEQYFFMFAIHNSFWVPMAALNFIGSTLVSLQSVQRKLSEFDWDSFTPLLCTRFGRDKHQLLIRQFYTVRQTSSVADYIERFEQIVNHLASYSDSIHPYNYLTHFVEGLRADIRAVVLIQRPPDLDTACSLALLQEEVAGEAQPAHQPPPTLRALDAGSRTSVPLPLPSPPRAPPGPAPTPTTDHRGVEGARADHAKVKAVREYRRARGLCFKCGERWGPDHTCPPRFNSMWWKSYSSSSGSRLSTTTTSPRLWRPPWRFRITLSLAMPRRAHFNCMRGYKATKS